MRKSKKRKTKNSKFDSYAEMLKIFTLPPRTEYWAASGMARLRALGLGIKRETKKMRPGEKKGE